jgi:hypothetical protein
MSDPSRPCRRFDRSLLEAGPLSGHVVAVFEHAALVRLNDGPLLTLLHPSRDLVPLGVAFDWGGAPLHDGATVRLAERALFVGESPAVQLEGEGTALSLQAAPFSVEKLKEQLPMAQRIGKRERTAVERRALQKAEESRRRIVIALTTGLYAPGELSGAARKLFGAGFGSTPTGDDWLVGLAGAGHRLVDTGFLFRPAWSALVQQLADVPSTATTPVARQMLRHAARGQLPEALLRFSSLLGNPTATLPAFRDACVRLLAVGSQTGGDFMNAAIALCAGVRGSQGGIA